MSNVNNVVLLGRLTRDPECTTFATGGKVAKFGFCVNDRRKGKDGQWEDDPMFIEVEAFNRGQGKTADLIEQYLSKGSQCCITGKLKLDQWEDKTTKQKRSKHKLVVDQVAFLGKKGDGVAKEAEPYVATGAGDDPNDIPF